MSGFFTRSLACRLNVHCECFFVFVPQFFYDYVFRYRSALGASTVYFPFLGTGGLLDGLVNFPYVSAIRLYFDGVYPCSTAFV